MPKHGTLQWETISKFKKCNGNFWGLPTEKQEGINLEIK